MSTRTERYTWWTALVVLIIAALWMLGAWN